MLGDRLAHLRYQKKNAFIYSYTKLTNLSFIWNPFQLFKIVFITIVSLSN